MRKKILCIIIVIMMTSATLIILPKNKFVKADSFYSNERIGLDYNFIYDTLAQLSEIVFDYQNAIDFGI